MLRRHGGTPRIRALTSLLFPGALTVPGDQASEGVDALAAIIPAGHRAGRFSDVDSGVAATIIQRTVEGVALHLRDHPDADLSGHAGKMVRFVDAALTGGSR